MSLSDFLSFLLFLPFRPCGAVYPRNTSQCPHEDGGANARGAEPSGCIRTARAVARDACIEAPVQRRHTEVCTPPAGSGHQSRESGRGSSLCARDTAQKYMRGKRIHNQPAARTSDCACKTITKGGVNLPFRRVAGGRYPGKPGIWDRWTQRIMGCRSRFNSGLSLIRAGEKLPDK